MNTHPKSRTERLSRRPHLHPKWHPSDHVVDETAGVVDRSGVVPGLQKIMDATPGTSRALPNVRFALTVFMLNAIRQHHRGHIKLIAEVGASLTRRQRKRLKFEDWDDYLGYQWFWRFFDWLGDVLAEGPEVEIHGRTCRLTGDVFLNAILAATHSPEMSNVQTAVIDGTAIETWAVLHSAKGHVVTPDEDGVDKDDDRRPAHMRSRRPKRQPPVPFAIGPDGREQWTKDHTAMGAWRTSTSKNKGREYIGYELHLAVAASGIRSTNGIDKVTFTEPVPSLILSAVLVPGSTHKGESAAELLKVAKTVSPKLNEVIADPGYTRAKEDRFFNLVRPLGLDVTFEPTTYQRGVETVTASALSFDGGLFSPHLPRHLYGVGGRGTVPFPLPEWKATEEECLVREAPYNERALFAMRRFTKPDSDGMTRFVCPFCGKRLRSRQVPKSMRLEKTVPRVELDHELERCCPTMSGIITVNAVDSVLWQRIPFGTTAWRKSYGRREIVESVNAALKGGFTDLEHGYVRVFTLTKIQIMLAFTLAGFNLDRYASFVRRCEREEAQARRRAKRRKGAWHPKPTLASFVIAVRRRAVSGFHRLSPRARAGGAFG
jgi:hypothetical protein